MISLLDDNQGENGFFGAAAESSGRPFVDNSTKKVVRGRREVRAVDGRGLPSGLDSESAPKEVVGLLSTSPTLVPGSALPTSIPAYRIACVTRVSWAKAECRARHAAGTGKDKGRKSSLG